MLRWSIGMAGVVLMLSSAQASPVWQSTFDLDADGVVDVVNGNLDKDLIGPISGGHLQINTIDKPGAHNDNDRGGRPLGGTLNGNDSFSGLYQFNFSDLNEDATQMWESAGFIGNAANVTHQMAGVMLRHWKAGGNYFMSLDMKFGGSGSGSGHAPQIFDATGTNGYGPFSPTAILLGGDGVAEGRPLQLAIGYDGNTRILRAELYTSGGDLISGNFVDLDTALAPTGSNTVESVLEAVALSHLGWAEYVATGGNRTTTWQVDSLAYYDSATGAFAAAIPEPTTAAVMVMLGVACLSRRGRHVSF